MANRARTSVHGLKGNAYLLAGSNSVSPLRWDQGSLLPLVAGQSALEVLNLLFHVFHFVYQLFSDFTGLKVRGNYVKRTKLTLMRFSSLISRSSINSSGGHWL